MALPSREHALLWIEENQLGRRNLTDGQRGDIAYSVLKRRAALAKIERAKKGGKAGGRHHPNVSLPDTAVGKLKLHNRSKESRRTVSKAARVSERMLGAQSRKLTGRSPKRGLQFAPARKLLPR